MKPPPETKPSLIRRIARGALWTCACIALLELSFMLVLRSSFGDALLTKYVPRLLEPVLAASGLRLQCDAIQGPLPEQLRVRGLRLEDKDGLWLELPELTIKLNLLEALSGVVHVEELSLDQLRLIRLPELPAPPAAASAPPIPPPAPLTLLPSPLKVRIANLRATHTTIAPQVLALPPTAGGLLFDVGGTLTVAERSAICSLGVDWNTPRERLLAEVRWSDNTLECTLNGGLTALAPLLSQAVPGTPALKSLGLNITAKADLPTLPPAPSSPLAFWLKSAVQLTTGGEKTETPLALRADANGSWDGTNLVATSDLDLRDTRAAAAMLALQGNFASRSGALSAEAIRLDVPDSSALLTGLEGLLPPEQSKQLLSLRENAPHGGLILKASGALEPSGRAEATLNLDVSKINWGTIAAGHAVGSQLAVALNLEGFPDSGGQHWRIENLRLTGESLSVQGQGGLDTAGRAEADLDVDLTDVGLLMGKAEAQPVRGRVSAKLHVDGPLDVASGGTGLLRAQVSARSPRLDFSVGPTSRADGVNLEASATVRAAGTTPEIDGSLRLNVAAVRGAPLRAEVSGKGSLTDMRVKALIDLLGLRLDGDIHTRMKEQGPLTDGTVNLAVTNWALLSALSGMPINASEARLTLRANARQGQQDVEANLRLRKLNLPTLENTGLDSLDARILAKDVLGQLPLPGLDATIDMGPGRVSVLAWNKGRFTAVTGGGKNGAIRPIAFTGAVSGPFSAEFRGAYTQQNAELRLETLRLDDTKRGLGARLTSPLLLRHASGLSLERTELALRPSGTVRLRLDLAPEKLLLETDIKDIPLELARMFSPEAPSGRLAASVALRGTSRDLSGTIRLDATDIGLAGLPPGIALHVNGSLGRSGGSIPLDVTARLEGLGDQPATASLRLPLRLPPGQAMGQTPGALPLPEPAWDAPLSGSLNWQGELAPLWSLVPLPGRSLSGTGMIQGTVRGSLTKPAVEAAAFVANGRFEDLVLGLLLADIELEARYADGKPAVIRLRATDGRQSSGPSNAPNSGTGNGTGSEPGSGPDNQQNKGQGVLAAAGSMDLQSSAPSLDVRGAFADFQPLRRDDLRVNLSGDFSVSGDAAAPKVVADIMINEAAYEILGGLGGSVRTLEVTDASKPSKIQENKDNPVGSLDVRLRAPRRIYVRGRGLSSEWKADMHIRGALNEPSLVGSIAPVRGTFELLKREFNFAGGAVTFTGGLPPNPALDLPLEYTGPDIKATVAARGSANAPKLELHSDPPLPQDEIIARVMFGKEFSQLSRLETIQVANEARTLAGAGGGIGGLRFMDTLRDGLGLDTLRLGSTTTNAGQRTAGRDASVASKAGTSTSATTLEAGKYILDNVYMGVEQGASENTTGVRVEVELLPNMSIDARTSSNSSSIGLNWKKDY